MSETNSPPPMAFQEKMDELMAAWEAFRETVAQELVPTLHKIAEELSKFIEALQREWLYIKLVYILPDEAALWLSRRWPKRLLPPVKWIL